MPDPSQFIAHFASLAAAGEPFACVTLVAAHGSVPHEPGGKILVTAAGLQFGTIGGGRLEHQAIGHAQQLLAPSGHELQCCQLVEWNLQRDVGMTCGGVVRLYFEAYRPDSWEIVLFGAGHVAQAVVRCLLPLDCRIRCLDSRAEWIKQLPVDPRVTAICSPDLADEVGRLPEEAYVLCMTMGHRSDRPILERLLASGREFPYVGVIGSRAKRAVLARELQEAGISHEAFSVVRCPIGLPLGSNHPAEIAISVTAELLQVRDQRRASLSAKPS